MHFIDETDLSIIMLDPYVVGLSFRNPELMISRGITDIYRTNQYNAHADLVNNQLKTGEVPNMYLPIDTYIPCEYFFNNDKFYSKYNFIEHLAIKIDAESDYIETSETPKGGKEYYFYCEFFDILRYGEGAHILLDEI